jgi:hypothetical protein
MEVLKQAREEAACDQKIEEICKERAGLLPKVKEKLRESRKPRMRTVEQYLCDGCDSVIMNPEDGFVVHGNIYMADPVYLDGLIGNNFPPKDGLIADVKKTVFCKRCFLQALGLNTKGNVNKIFSIT